MTSFLNLIITIFLPLSLLVSDTFSLSTFSPEPSPQSHYHQTTSDFALPVPEPEPNYNSATSPYSSSTLTPILTSLGYHDLALASQSLSISATASSSPFPLTIFAPSDASLRSCTTCSLPLLLQEHSLPGLYPSSYLHSLPPNTKLHTLLPGHCLTLSHSSSSPSAPLVIDSSDVIFPDLYTSSHLIIHGVHSYSLSHLSPYSCTSLASMLLPRHEPSPMQYTALTRMMLLDAMIRLRSSGYSILALAMRVKYNDLVTLRNMTIFAVDDYSIFHGGHSYVHSVRFHILPNILLHYSDLDRLRAGTVIPTFAIGESLAVTTGGGGGLVAPVRINYVRIKYPDLLYNMKIVVHGLSSPFPRLSHSTSSTSFRQQYSSSSSVAADVSSANPDSIAASSSGETVSQNIAEGLSSSSSVFRGENDDHVDNNAAGYVDDEGHRGL